MRGNDAVGLELASTPSSSDVPPVWRPTLAVAQTNIQLYNQLQHLGCPTPDLARVYRAYELALVLFVCSHRASGKPTLAHHVGVASLLAGAGLPADTVIAGLLHAAYALGDFGDGRTGPSASRRWRVRDVAGDAVEQILMAFDALRWNRHRIPQLAAEAAKADALQRAVLTVRLANEIENHLDLNMAYCKQFSFRQRFAVEQRSALVSMSHALGVPRLGTLLEQVFDEFARCEVPAELRRSTRLSMDVRPRSMRLRLRPRLRRTLDGLVRRLRRSEIDPTGT